MRKGLQWPLGVAAVLLLTVAGNVWVAVLAADDPSAAIEERYYDKAVNFDARLALAQRAQRLGWTVRLVASAMGPDGVTLTPRLVDRAGVPVAGVHCRVTARHVARASEALQGEAVLDSDGTAALHLPMHRRGLWDVEFEAWRAGEHFATAQRLDLGEGPPVATP